MGDAGSRERHLRSIPPPNILYPASSFRLLRPHNRFQAGDNFVRRQAVGRNFDRIVRLSQRADGSRRIALIAQSLVGQYFFERNLFATAHQIAMTSPGSLFFVGREKDLAFGIGEDNRSLIATFRHNVALGSCGPLPHNKLSANRPIVGRVVDYRGDIKLADRGRHIFAIQKHAITDQLDVNLANQPRELLAVGQIVAALTGRERNRPIHGPRIEEAKPESPRQLTRCATLPGSGRSVDGYDHGCSWFVVRSPLSVAI